MRCSICGKEGHNARTCPQKNQDVNRDYAMLVKYDNISQSEARKLANEQIKMKQKHAPASRATMFIANKKELPEKVRNNLSLQEPSKSKK